ncbi:hypothetical protein V1T75_14365 [Tenacibaculum sp. FZY0031]|uniref:hypothetical protein n=1 Tax=Tenacibaculum sp. FZY0031 TaxID=3116648 RepID=UPI002EA28BD3|nr:hypothetical protein [Tenacibaculum sp. FZY0031]
MRKVFIVSVILLAIVSCSSPLDKKFNEERAAEDIKAVQSEIDSTELGMLVGSMLRLKLEGEKVEGLTYREILEKGKRWKEKEEKLEKEQKFLAEKAKKEELERINRLSESVVISCFEKGFYKYKYEDYITYKFVIQNKSNKNIRAVKGSLIFSNLFDEEIKTINLVYDKVLTADTTVNYEAQTDYNQFSDSDKALKNKELKDMKVKWKPEKIIFEDGTTLE